MPLEADFTKPYRGKISNWGIIPFTRSTNMGCYVIVGKDPDGHYIRTSPIVNLRLPFRNASNEISEVETENSIYTLDGPPNHQGAQILFNILYGKSP